MVVSHCRHQDQRSPRRNWLGTHKTPALKIELQSLEAHGPNPDLEDALQAAVKGRANALITIGSSLLSRYPKRIADLAIKNRLPAMCDRTDYVEAGGLVSYSANDVESYRRAATYVDKSSKALSLVTCL